EAGPQRAAGRFPGQAVGRRSSHHAGRQVPLRLRAHDEHAGRLPGRPGQGHLDADRQRADREAAARLRDRSGVPLSPRGRSALARPVELLDRYDERQAHEAQGIPDGQEPELGRDPRPSVSAPAGTLGTLRKSLAEGRATLGYLVTTPSVQIAQALARTGVDWLMIDTEHAPVGIESVAAMIAATGGTPATPIVRVPAARPELVKPVLDCGALGVVFPQIATRQEAEATVQAVRYAPKGQRGYGPTYAALRWGLPNLEYLRSANDAVLNVVLIESRAGVDALDDILSVSGLDVVAVARGDLSQNLGVAGQFDHPHLREVVAKAEAKILAHGEVALGGIAFSPEDARAMIGRGHRFIVLGSDAGLISGAAQRTVQAIRA